MFLTSENLNVNIDCSYDDKNLELSTLLMYILYCVLVYMRLAQTFILNSLGNRRRREIRLWKM